MYSRRVTVPAHGSPLTHARGVCSGRTTSPRSRSGHGCNVAGHCSGSRAGGQAFPRVSVYCSGVHPWHSFPARALTSTTHGGTIEGATVHPFPTLPAWLTVPPWRVLFRRTVARLQGVALPGALTHARACVAGVRLQGVTRDGHSRRVLTCNGSRGGRAHSRHTIERARNTHTVHRSRRDYSPALPAHSRAGARCGTYRPPITRRVLTSTRNTHTRQTLHPFHGSV